MDSPAVAHTPSSTSREKARGKPDALSSPAQGRPAPLLQQTRLGSPAPHVAPLADSGSLQHRWKHPGQPASMPLLPTCAISCSGSPALFLHFFFTITRV